ncbi:MAG: multidrug effflux MFS transporter [Nevskia sp.]|nr:multidrug effflux MFS transporter [Nevskia sp.]
MLGPFSIDTFFPAFQAMEREFDIGAVAMKQTISVYMIAYSAMSLLHGPLSDTFGRRGVILFSLVLYVAGCAACAAAPTFHALLLGRAVQGVSAGAGVICGRAIIRDRFEGPAAQRLMSQVTLIFGMAPALAPIVGGWVLYFAGWRWIFWSMDAFTVLLLLAALQALPETHPRGGRTPFSYGGLMRTYRAIAGDGRFLLLGFTAAFNFGALFIYIASAPEVVLTLLHLNERQFAWLFIPTISGMMIGAALSGRLAGKASARRTVQIGYCLIAAGTCAGLADAWLLQPRLPWFVLPIALDGIGVSLTFPTLTLLMLDRFPAVRGAAASVQMSLNIGFNALLAGMASPLVSHAAAPLALFAFGSSACGFACWSVYRRLSPEALPSVRAGDAAEAAVPPSEL